MFDKLRALFAPKPPAPRTGPPGVYRAYTTRYDREVAPSELGPVRGSPEDPAFRRAIEKYDAALQDWRTAVSIAGIRSVERLIAAHGDRPLAGTVVSILIDHSGSMRGQRAILAAALAEFLSEYCARLGAAVEVLGFTTLSWRGGFSRQAWQRAGQPADPGRLCDLLHIVYRKASDTNPGVGWGIHHLLRDDLLKENVDGEAVQWAAARLRQRPEARKILIAVSDGAPVDDSTLLENPSDYLDRHLRETLSALAAAGDVEALGIGIDHDLTRYYPKFVRVTAIAHYAERILPFLEAAFAPAP